MTEQALERARCHACGTEIGGERLLVMAGQLRGLGEPGGMSELVDRAAALLRTGVLPEPTTAP